MTKYKRILLKLSGESLMGKSAYGIAPEMTEQYSRDIAETLAEGVQIAVVIGGGNIFRGMTGTGKGIDRVKGDNMGMLATVINSMALQSALENAGVKAKTLTSVCMDPIGEHYSTTDSASALRGVELKVDILLKGTRVDGVYTSDPEKDPTAVKYRNITFTEAYDKGLKIMDLTAFTLCRENALPVLVFDMNTPGNLRKAVAGEPIGTIIIP